MRLRGSDKRENPEVKLETTFPAVPGSDADVTTVAKKIEVSAAPCSRRAAAGSGRATHQRPISLQGSAAARRRSLTWLALWNCFLSPATDIFARRRAPAGHGTSRLVPAAPRCVTHGPGAPRRWVHRLQSGPGRSHPIGHRRSICKWRTRAAYRLAAC